MAVKNQAIQANSHIVDLITPNGLEFHSNEFWFGDQMARAFVITGYPSSVQAGWLSRIANMDGVVCSIHVNPTNPHDLIENINKSIGELSARLGNGNLSALLAMRTEQQLSDAHTLLKKIDQEQENVFNVSVSIMVTGRDKEDLDHRAKRVKSALAASKLRGREAMHKQREALLAVGPYGILPSEITEIARRNMPISTIAAAFPFNASGLNDGTGYILGKDVSGGIVLIDTWKRGGDRTNSNWTVLGAPGVGKSTAIKKILMNEWALGTKIIILDPEREYKELCENLGGQWINCGGGSGGRINPLMIKAVPSDDESDDGEKLFIDEGNGLGPLALHMQSLRAFFSLYMKGLTPLHEALLDELLEDVYRNKGITWETDISNLKNDDYPLMEDIYKLALERAENEDLRDKKRDLYDDLAALLRRLAIGADAGLFNYHTTINPDSDFIVLDIFDLQEADDNVKRTQYYNILTWAWQQIANDRSERVLLAVDEAYLCVDPEVPQAIKFMRNTSKRIRKYNGGLMVISQSAVDFLDPAVRRFGQALLDNPCFKFFMGADGKDLEELSKILKLTEAEQDLLTKKKRGHGLLFAGSKRFHIEVLASEFELKMFGKGGGA